MAKKDGKPTPPENTAVIYARYSTENQRETSIEAQLRACLEYAAKNNLKIIEEYCDRAKSGTTMEKREQLKKMMADSKKGKFSKVLIFSLDRFSRNLRDYLNNTYTLERNGVSLRSVTEHIDDSYSGKILAAVIMLNAEMYVSNLAEHIKKNQKEAALKGLYVGGTLPLGYFVDSNKEYVIDENEAAIVRQIFKMYASGKSYREIIGHLNAMGHRTKSSGEFGSNSLYHILKNEKYIGTYKFGKDSEPDKCIVLENRIPPIIGKELFDEVQAKLVENKLSSGRNRAKRNYMLSGLIKCGVCGANMHINSRKNKNNTLYSSYICPNSRKKECPNNRGIRRKFLERYVMGKINYHLFAYASLDEITAMLNEYNASQSEKTHSELDGEKRALSEIKKRIRNLTDSIASGTNSKAIKDELKKLEREKSSVEKHIGALKAGLKVKPISCKETFELIKNIKKTLSWDNAPECRDFLEYYVKEILVYKKNIKVKLNIDHD
ncbi:MAG: recombinase family protein [Holosporaceae bacterium]|jgi:site-specific DNA recombinase|nr:recombinase family protein [Holosporaceae bacterium]